MGDEKHINALYKLITDKYRSRDEYLWEWINTWNGQGSIWLVFDDERIADDQLIAQYSLIPTPLSFFGKNIVAGKTENCMSHPDIRGTGVYFPHEKKYFEIAKKRFMVFITTTGNVAKGAPGRVREKLGYRAFDDWAIYSVWIYGLGLRQKILTMITPHINNNKFIGRILSLTERKALRKLAGLTANSNATAETISKAYDIPPEKIQTIYLGLDIDSKPVDDQLEKERCHQPIMLLVGGNVQRKGLHVILKIMPALIKEIPGLTLQVIGKNQNIGRMKKIAEKLGVLDCVEFIGWISPEKIKTYYRKASVFVMPSLMEGFGLVFLEAMAQGLPVIGGNVGGTLELIKDGENGFLVNPDDVNTLKEKIREYLINLDLRKRIIKNGYSTVRKYPAQKMVDNTINLYSNFSNE